MTRRSWLLVVAGMTLGFLSQSFGQPSPLHIASAIASRIIRDTDLSLRAVPQKPLPGLQVIDLGSLFGRGPSSVGYASTTLLCEWDTTISFGLSHDCPLHLWVNGRTVYASPTPHQLVFKEIGYDLYQFNDTMRIPLQKGENWVLLKGKLSAPQNLIFLKELNPRNSKVVGRFSLEGVALDSVSSYWRFAGPYIAKLDPYAERFGPEHALSANSTPTGDSVTWRYLPVRTVSEFAIKPDAVYSRESYAEWSYPNGTVLLSLLSLTKRTGDETYARFVERVCGFTLMHLPDFEREYVDRHARGIANYRIFRRCMLDDTGAPVLPYVELVPEMKHDALRPLVDTMAVYVSRGQVRLPDGTLCRYEPMPFTIWADDLFMSVPFLLRLGELTGKNDYFDDAAKQILNFNRYLVDRTTGLYRHGFYEFKKEQTPVSWGRANGWVVWAHSEALLHLPKSHPNYRAIAEVFRHHMEALIAFQDSSGLWHQVLNRPDSFEETSCTAMFMIGLARGLRLGILDQNYAGALRKAWRGLQTRISKDGIVKDICRGTEIGNSPSYYFARERFDNDPRGLGAVITALVEAGSLLK